MDAEWGQATGDQRGGQRAPTGPDSWLGDLDGLSRAPVGVDKTSQNA